MDEEKRLRNITNTNQKEAIFTGLGIIFFSFLTFIGEGKLRIEDWYQVIHSTGAGGHHENLITVLKKSSIPGYLKGDLYADSLQYFFFPFVEGMKLFYRLGMDFNLQSILLQWIGRIVYLSSIYYLCRFLVSSKLVPWLVMAFLIRTRIIIGEFPLLSYFDPNMEISISLCLFSLLLFLKDKRDMAACLASVATLFHYRFPALLLLFYLVWLTFNWKTVTKRTMIIGTTGAILFSIPFLNMILPLLLNHSTPENNEIAKLIIFSAIANEFAPFSTIGYMWPRYGFLFFTSVIGLKFFFSYEYKLSSPLRRDLRTFLIFTLVLVLLQFIFTEITLSLFFLKLQTNRILQIFAIFMIIWSSQYLMSLIEKNKNNFLNLLTIFYMLALFYSDTFFHFEISEIKIYPFYLMTLILMFYFFKKSTSFQNTKEIRLPRVCLIWIFIFTLICSAVYFTRLSVVMPERWRLLDDWKSVQMWAKKNTRSDSIFFTPSGVPAFRTFSERTPVGDLYDLHLVVSLNPAVIPQVYQRLKDIEFPMINSLDDRHDFWKEIMEGKNLQDKYNETLNEQKYLAIHKKVKFDYIIRRKNMPLNFNEKFSNTSFIIYKIDKSLK